METRLKRRETELMSLIEETKAAAQMNMVRLAAIHASEMREKDEQLVVRLPAPIPILRLFCALGCAALCCHAVVTFRGRSSRTVVLFFTPLTDRPVSSGSRAHCGSWCRT